MKYENLYTQFYVNFNHSRQSLSFKIHNMNLKTFENLNDCGAYYIGREHRKKRKGLFGYINLPHFSRRSPYWHNLIAHEVQHAIWDWILCRKCDINYLISNEERIATMVGNITEVFWTKYTNI